jgi:hypothetical protein
MICDELRLTELLIVVPDMTVVVELSSRVATFSLLMVVRECRRLYADFSSIIGQQMSIMEAPVHG